MNLATLQLKLTQHGYWQYCKRVGPINYADLCDALRAAIDAGAYSKRSGKFMQIDGVWWVARIRKGCLVLVTCYGRSDLDLPKALKWAKRSKDRIRLGGEVLCDAEREAKEICE